MGVLIQVAAGGILVCIIDEKEKLVFEAHDLDRPYRSLEDLYYEKFVSCI